MTPQEIRDAVADDAQIAALLPDTQAVADALSVGRVRVVETLGGVGVVMEALGPVAGAAVLDGLDALRATSSPVKWAWVLIERGELDFGSAATRGMIEQMAADGMFPAEVATALLAVAEVPDPISAYEVQIAVYGNEGSMVDAENQFRDSAGNPIATFQKSKDMGGVSLSFAGIWHTPTMLEQYAAHMNQLAQQLRDEGVQ